MSKTTTKAEHTSFIVLLFPLSHSASSLIWTVCVFGNPFFSVRSRWKQAKNHQL